MPRVLVTGAGGKTGRAVAAALAAQGGDVRGLVRDPARGAGGGFEIAVGDQRRVADVAATLEDVDALYAIAPNMGLDEVAMAHTAIEACRARGVERLVLHSVVHPQLRAMPHHHDKSLAEEMVVQSGLAWTILQPNVYLQNLADYVDDLHAGIYRVPYAVDAATAMVDLGDVARVAARVLVEDVGVHATFELSGPEERCPADVAAVASVLLGHPVAAERTDPDDWLAANRHLPAAARLHAMFRHYDQHGSPGDATVLRHLLGREPRHLADVLGELLG
jgi:NAD(P)H dehydrogenase (quinone)